MTGFVFKLSTGPVSLPTAEAEYVALSHAVQEAIWLRHLLEDLGYFN